MIKYKYRTVFLILITVLPVLQSEAMIINLLLVNCRLSIIPTEFMISNPYPNPFNPVTVNEIPTN